MKNNQPVTDVETPLPEGQFIYSMTDLRGIIIEANEVFAHISGFQREEMLGKAHNLIRHPDMPTEAFADLWQDLHAGRPWSGLVKNRRKDGGFYWVVANISPVREGGQVIGYQSVRTCPTRADVAAASEAYQRIRNGDRSLRIVHGRAVPVSRMWLAKLTSFHVQTRCLGLLLLLLAAVAIADAVTGAPGLHRCLSGLAMACALFALPFTLWAQPRMRRDLQALTAHMEYVLCSGDLKRRFALSRRDHLGDISRIFENFTTSVQATVQSIGDAAGDVAKATRKVEQGVGAMIQSATIQGDATSVAAAAVEEVTVAIGEVAAHAGATRDTAVHSRQLASDGAKQSDAASNTVHSLSATVKTSALQVEQLGRRVTEISRITATIKEIADQTNLLALNAAIEAARAGETGRGFAVVADEVRKLAERTGAATQEIAGMLSAINSETERAVAGMQAGAIQVEESVQLVSSSRHALDEINGEMAKTTEMVSEISHATVEQEKAMAELSGNINRVAEMTEQNYNLAAQTGKLAEQLDGMMTRMLKAVHQYKT